MAEQKLDKQKITEELELLQLEETRERVHQIRSKRSSRVRRMESRERSLADKRRREKFMQDNCLHKKGGKGVEGRFKGNDANYAVVKHTLSHGPTIVICQRCFKIWEAPDTALNTKKASMEERREYKRQYDEYTTALNYPTDNEPSGTQLFVITRDPAA